MRKQWEGTVTEIRDSEFVALLRDASDPGAALTEAVFDQDEVMKGDEHLIVPGAVFTWTIGRETKPHGQRQNVDFIRFLRFPVWTHREVEAIKRRASELERLFGDERESGGG